MFFEYIFSSFVGDISLHIKDATLYIDALNPSAPAILPMNDITTC